MKAIKLILVTWYLFSGGSYVSSAIDLSLTNASTKLRRTTSNYVYNGNGSDVKMCRLCTREMADEEEWKRNDMSKDIKQGCFARGLFHEFWRNHWPVSILPSKNRSEACYIDIYAPKSAFSEEEKKAEDRLYITPDCQNGCHSMHNRFKISKQRFIKYSYGVTRKNESGKVKL